MDRYYTIDIKARLQPLYREELFEEPLEKIFEAKGIGRLDGGGTLQSANGEIESCDISFIADEKHHDEVLKILSAMAVMLPKGSMLVWQNNDENDDGYEELPIGSCEGMGIYLNGTELPEEVYRECDVNFVISELIRLMGEEYYYFSFHEGAEETALYFYGTDFGKMTAASAEFISGYPLCSKCRIVKLTD